MTECRILLATGNAHKVQEIRDILAGEGLELWDLGRFPGLPEPRESGQSFLDNARIKARHYYHLTGLPTLADDSGLEVDALGGEPGVHSARYGGADLPHSEKIRLILEKLREVPPTERTARFRCVAVLVGEGEPLVASGVCEGRIAQEPRGEHGFGYDPIFFLPERGCTMAELPPQEKNRISHRAQAMRALAQSLRARVGGCPR
ncbi:MAG TPA: RdgB/HAM1 family non-canonical purine NTP pyrophosphatase [Candidatus Nitrosotenuis sp.]|jgi:XTP/dITP diphosphohydrolase|nr:RdgB/HAM1 family non-canonical purine NTP pyrophosphatase [Candidatus Nitrosotenuis sp.]